jgi:hypothetical protein
MIYTHFFGFLVLLVQFMHYHSSVKWKKEKRKEHWQFFLKQLIIGLSFIPWAIIFTINTKASSRVVWLDGPSFSYLLGSFREFAGGMDLVIIFGLLIIYLAVKNWNEKISLLLLWAFLPTFLVFTLSVFIIPVFHTRYFVFTIPAIILASAYSLTTIPKNIKLGKFNIKKLWVYIFIIIITLSCYYVILGEKEIEKDEWEKIKFDDSAPTFIHPFYHQYTYTFYFNKDCFKEIDFYTCNLEKNILSLKHDAGCCKPYTSTTSGQNLSYYDDKEIVLIDINSKIYDNNTFLRYLNNTRDILEKEEYEKNLKVYRFSRTTQAS